MLQVSLRETHCIFSILIQRLRSSTVDLLGTSSPPPLPPSVHGSVLPRWTHACVERESVIVSVGFSHCTSSSSTVERSREEESREHSLPPSLRFLKKWPPPDSDQIPLYFKQDSHYSSCEYSNRFPQFGLGSCLADVCLNMPRCICLWKSECTSVRAPVYKSLDPDLLLTMDLRQHERLLMTMYLP